MMTFLQAWADSLTLLKPKNFQLFAMVTLKSIIEAYKLMFKYFWWLALLIVLCYSPLFLSIGSVGIGFWLFHLLLFAVCTITRPSIVKKDCAYFRSQLYSFLYVAVFLLLLPKKYGVTAFSPWMIFLIFFFLDSEKGPKNFLLSMWYALKMILFNFPLMFCVYVIMWLFDNTVFWITNKIIFGGIMQWIPVPAIAQLIWLNGILSILWLPILVCPYANIYIKKLHDQFDLYYKQPQ